ncbi:MAG: rRNA maturation RNase YbeY [Bryobacteraceae bacterium]|nr:rRNA maturation RNase YbeY [Bryobacteraceae bacterium]
MSPDDSTLLFRRAGQGLDRKSLRLTAKRLEREVAQDRRFRCLLTDDRELKRLNSQFFNKSYPTDVLSFPEADPEAPFLGEMAISVERAAEQARECGHTVEQEIGILMLHGALHLLGMDHERDRGQMKRIEIRWRQKLGLPPGLIERAGA